MSFAYKWGTIAALGLVSIILAYPVAVYFSLMV